MSENLSTLKRLAVCIGCCECTEDIPAQSNSEALDFICDNYKLNGVTAIELVTEKSGKIKSGTWTDSAGKHEITIRR